MLSSNVFFGLFWLNRRCYWVSLCLILLFPSITLISVWATLPSTLKDPVFNLFATNAIRVLSFIYSIQCDRVNVAGSPVNKDAALAYRGQHRRQVIIPDTSTAPFFSPLPFNIWHSCVKPSIIALRGCALWFPEIINNESPTCKAAVCWGVNDTIRHDCSADKGLLNRDTKVPDRCFDS